MESQLYSRSSGTSRFLLKEGVVIVSAGNRSDSSLRRIEFVNFLNDNDDDDDHIDEDVDEDEPGGPTGKPPDQLKEKSIILSWRNSSNKNPSPRDIRIPHQNPLSPYDSLPHNLRTNGKE